MACLVEQVAYDACVVRDRVEGRVVSLGACHLTNRARMENENGGRMRWRGCAVRVAAWTVVLGTRLPIVSKMAMASSARTTVMWA